MLVEKEKCSGCAACYSVCPKNAIKMIPDDEGFLYPIIDSELCVNCSLCEKVCSSIYKFETKLDTTYAAISTNEDARLRSSSGGIFYELAISILDRGGYVCGASFDSNNQVHHIVINEKEKLDLLMRSKYVQSRIEGVMREVKELLNNGNIVLFVGTACQVNGLKLYLRKDYDNLITCDIICHGVPSPKVWNYYLEDIKKNHNEKTINSVNFRDKSNGWSNFNVSINFENGSYKKSHHDDLFYKSFLTDHCLRPSCYDCYCKGNNRSADITLADFWGFDNFDLKLEHNDKGLSLLIIHTTKGLELINNNRYINIEKVSKKSLSYNPSYSTSVNKPIKRDEYMMRVNPDNFEELTKKYTYVRISMIRKILSKVKSLIKKIFKIKK